MQITKDDVIEIRVVNDRDTSASIFGKSILLEHGMKFIINPNITGSWECCGDELLRGNDELTFGYKVIMKLIKGGKLK